MRGYFLLAPIGRNTLTDKGIQTLYFRDRALRRGHFPPEFGRGRGSCEA